jgi:exonuclease III
MVLAGSFLLTNTRIAAQNYELVAVGYYNLENLFDTIDSEGVEEGDFLPDGSKKWNAKKYYYKLDQMAKVISEIATDKTKDGLAVLGVSEIENRFVLEDLVKTDALKDRNYQIVHYNSPDKRGIDVALLYNPKYFELTNSYSAPFRMADTSFKSRDQLVVTGNLSGEEVHFQVNHWPSRSGGEKRSRPKRNAAGELARSLSDSLLAINPNAKIMIMGDLNDDPTNHSVSKYLKATDNKKKLEEGYFYNPYMTLYKKGQGSLAYRDTWNLFDQVILTPALVNEDRESWSFYKANIFKKQYMINQEGQYKGYPKRSFVGNKFQGGYSDHFPVYVYLVRKAK